MPRLWILLVIVWYRAITLAKTQTTDQFLTHQLSNGAPSVEEVQGLPKKPTFSGDANPQGEKLQDIQLWKLMRDHQSNTNTRKKREGQIVYGKGITNVGKENYVSEKINESDNANKNIEDTIDSVVNKDIFDVSDERDDEENQENKKENLIDNCVSLAVNKRTFNSWGGKRSLQNNDFDEILQNCIDYVHQTLSENQNVLYSYDDKRTKFNPCTGKRNKEEEISPKRLPFRAWGGKRGKANSQTAPKRIPFRPWGGKRSPEENQFQLYSDPRTPILDNMAILSLTRDLPPSNEKRINRKKTKFHSWGGKRSFDFNGEQNQPEAMFLFDARSTRQVNDLDQKSQSQDGSGMGQRRLKFNSWGGKRSAFDGEDFEEFNPEDKRTFNAWGGKRGISTRSFNSWGGKRSYDDYPMIEDYKRTFNSWGGK